MSARGRALVLLGAAGLITAGCSATGGASADRNGALRLNGGPGVSVAGGGTAPGGGPAAAGGAAAAGSGGSAPAGAIAAGGGAAGGAGGATGPVAGAGAAPIEIGYYGTEATNGNQFGLNGQVLGDPKTIGTAMANWVNSHGGLAGHPIKLLVATTPLVSSTPQDQVDQAACAQFTEDNHVFAALSITLTTATMYNCLATHHVLYIANTVYEPDEAYYQAHADMLYSTAPTQDRMGAAEADGLWRAGYFNDPGEKIGVITSDYPWFRSGVSAFEQAAAAHGGRVADVATVCHTPCSESEMLNDGQNDVLKFRSEGINHVVLTTLESALAFQEAAQSAAFDPKYGVDSNTVPYDLAAELPASAFAGGAVGAGYSPALDVAPPQNPPLSPQTQLCNQIMAQAGVDESAFAIEIQTWMTCDTFFMLKAAVDRAGRPDYGAMQGAIESLGAGYRPANGFSDWFGPGRHDGAQTYRLIAYSAACRCFQYTGPTEYPFPVLPGESH